MGMEMEWPISETHITCDSVTSLGIAESKRLILQRLKTHQRALSR